MLRESEKKRRGSGEEERDREKDTGRQTLLQTPNEDTAGGRASSNNTPLLIKDLKHAGIKTSWIWYWKHWITLLILTDQLCHV